MDILSDDDNDVDKDCVLLFQSDQIKNLFRIFGYITHTVNLTKCFGHP